MKNTRLNTAITPPSTKKAPQPGGDGTRAAGLMKDNLKKGLLLLAATLLASLLGRHSRLEHRGGLEG
ncbi:MAG: hypothetical protein IKK73_00115, partial [Akkermansia sp.]|nr:hypothetical protein [Akkermansia sp.]